MVDPKPLLSFDEFRQQWLSADEVDEELLLDVAWRRYQHVNDPSYETHLESDDPTLDQLKTEFDPLLSNEMVASLVVEFKYMTLQADTLPWTATGIIVSEDQPISVFAIGRTWRSKILDLYLTPQFNLWYRIGVNSSIFNSTHDTRTFKCIDGQSGELFVSNQFPGSFQDHSGGRVSGNLSVYNKAQGAFQILIIQWRPGFFIDDLKTVFCTLYDLSRDKGSRHVSDLLSTALERLNSDYFTHRFPAGWKLLWFLGVSEIFSQEQSGDIVSDQDTSNEHAEEPLEIVSSTEDDGLVAESVMLASPLEKSLTNTSQTMIRCVPYGNVGILQRDLTKPFPMTKHTITTWTWNIIALPSRLREDTTISHDYLSLAFEFENGRDLTYTWSWELPIGFGYWCPLAAWCDREYHVVVRSGTEQLGQWLAEERNIHADYVAYINAGDTRRTVPKLIVRVWLIAGNRWQRHRGEMLVKQIMLVDGTSSVGKSHAVL